MRSPHPNARSFRKAMPSAEQRLWSRLRRRQLGEFRFRRQHTIGPYIADFACLEAKLVIELDGDSHGHDAAEQYDRRRNAFMEGRGWLVLRFWNSELHDNIDGVLATILDAAENCARELAIDKPDTP